MKVELLSPAGSYEAFLAALNAGADAVYLGGNRFGARAYAGNLTDEELLKAIDYAHIQDKRLYLTLNTLLKDVEIEKQLYEYLTPLYTQGLDGVIVQDLGVIKFIQTYFGDLPVHASTQMCITGTHGVKILQEMGVSRVVTARELSLGEIRKIKNETDMEIESFVHGALCYCYSGQCLYSSMLGGRSGNRGRCAQPCRLPYSVMENNKMISKKSQPYLLSPKDICTLGILPEIIEAGVYSLKIEGRMKSSVYTSEVTSMYRKYIDLLEKNGKERYFVEQTDFEYLTGLYSRNGSSEGYYKKRNGRELITLTKPGYVSQPGKESEKKELKKHLQCQVSLEERKPVEITVTDGEYTISLKGAEASEALNKPLTKETVIKQFEKTGGTGFFFSDIQVNLTGSVFIPMGELNGMRREALECYTKEVLRNYRRALPEQKEQSVIKENNKSGKQKDELKLYCLASNLEQWETFLKIKEVYAVYLEYHAVELKKINYYIEKTHEMGKKLYLALPFIFRADAAEFLDRYIKELERTGLDGYLIRNLDELGYLQKKSLKGIRFDSCLYTFNREAKELCYRLGAENTTVPLELNFKELVNRGCETEEIIVYGHLPLMVSTGCIKKTLNCCDKKSGSVVLSDRYKKNFLVRNNCTLCYNVIYNSDPLSLLDVGDKVKSLQAGCVRLNFADENKEETADITNRFAAAFIYHDRGSGQLQSYTRGHFNRGVE